MKTTDDRNTPPNIPCACCSHPLEACWQQPLYEGMKAYWFITCQTKDCQLYGYTFTSNQYPPENLFERYGVARCPPPLPVEW